MEAYKVTVDDLFLPTIFVIFISSLSSVCVVNYYSKPSETSIKWKARTVCFYLLSAISFILQLKVSWMLDFLHQIELAAEPLLWQRLLGDFILAHKLTLDTTENYWITSQLLLFTLSFVAFVNMYSKKMELRFHQILGYLVLGLTGSHGGVLALFLVHFYNAGSISPLVAKLTTGQFFAQGISTLLGCAAVVFLYDASVPQVRVTLLPFFVTTFLVPFALFPFQEKNPKAGTTTALLYFLISLSVFMMLHHFFMTYMVAFEWLNLKTIILVAFGHPYQHAVSVDLICCIVISSVFVQMEFHELNKLQLGFEYPHLNTILKVLVSFPCIVVVTFIISPGAMLLFFLAYREMTSVLPSLGSSSIGTL